MIKSDIVGRLSLDLVELGMIGRVSRRLVGTIGLNMCVLSGSAKWTVGVFFELSVGAEAGSSMVNVGLEFFLSLVLLDSLGALDGSRGNNTGDKRAVEDFARGLKADGAFVTGVISGIGVAQRALGFLL